MATKSTKIEEEEVVEATSSKPAKKEPLNLDETITIKNTSDWTVGFARINTIGDVQITPNGNYRLTRAEVIAQVQNNNTLLNGIDGEGSHATIYIDDQPTRVEVGFESEDGKKKQLIISDELIKSVFDERTKTAFEKAFKNSFVTRSEQKATMNSITRLGINDYNRIRFAENYTGMNAQ